MKERPILFSGPMVRALLDGRKTQTRRVVTDRNSVGNFKASELDRTRVWSDPGLGAGQYLKSYLTPAVADRLGHGPDDVIERLHSRYEIGDRLYVRETWAQGISYTPSLRRIAYRATEPDLDATWKPSIHMPRWASRISLEITEVRIERIQAISHADCEAEGIERGKNLDNTLSSGTVKSVYAQLWDSINAKRGYGWDVNPFVWALTFTVVTP